MQQSCTLFGSLLKGQCFCCALVLHTVNFNRCLGDNISLYACLQMSLRRQSLQKPPENTLQRFHVSTKVQKLNQYDFSFGCNLVLIHIS